MLLASFYRVIERKNPAENFLIVAVEFEKDHAVFAGHFPEHPVVPGVFIIQLIHELIEDFLGKKIRLSSSRKIKFVSLVIPEKGNVLTFEISFSTAAVHTVSVVANFAGQPCLKLHAVFTEL